MFNSQEIPENSNKKPFSQFLTGGKGIFSLVITNVSEKDFGNYSCRARVRDGGHTLYDEDFIELSLYKKGEFHCCSDFYNNIPVIYKATLKLKVLALAVKASANSYFFHGLPPTWNKIYWFQFDFKTSEDWCGSFLSKCKKLQLLKKKNNIVILGNESEVEKFPTGTTTSNHQSR